jgi:transcriptional regulator with XRE-family HTH domain
MVTFYRYHRSAGDGRRRRRKRQNATQVEVAAAMGISQARVSRIEKGF